MSMALKNLLDKVSARVDEQEKRIEELKKMVEDLLSPENKKKWTTLHLPRS